MAQATSLSTSKVADGVYEVKDTIGPLYIMRDTSKRKRWGDGDEWDVVKFEGGIYAPDAQISFLITAGSKAECVERLCLLKAALS